MWSVKASSGLALLLALGVPLTHSFAVTRQNPDQRSGDKAASSTKVEAAPAVEVINGTSRVIKDFNAPQSAGGMSRHSKTVSASTSVEVINGAAQRTVILNPNHAPTAMRIATRHKAARHHRKRATVAKKEIPVEVIWGTQKYTRVFEVPADQMNGSSTEHRNLTPDVIGIASSGSRSQHGKSEPVVVGILSSGTQGGASSAQPVVVGIASSSSQSAVGNAQPVVIGITSSGAQAERNAEPVAVGVAPRPEKRRPYRPAVLDAQ
jgi:hypothetical protein